MKTIFTNLKMYKSIFFYLTVILMSLFHNLAQADPYIENWRTTNYNIPDNNGAWASSEVIVTGAPAGKIITKVVIAYDIIHTCPMDLDVWVTLWNGSSWQDYYFHHTNELGCDPNNIHNLGTSFGGGGVWGGLPANQTWYLSVKDNLSGDGGYIDYFHVRVYYANAPDLTIVNENVTPTTVEAGNTINVSCKQKINYGVTTEYLYYPYVRYYLSTNTICSASDTYLNDEDESGLNGWYLDEDEDATLTIPPGTSAGTYYVCFIGDYYDDIDESDENNNCANVQIIVNSCTVSVPSGSTVSSSSGTKSISVTSNGTSTWSASESCSWVSLSPTSGTGNRTVTATYQQNTSGNSRSCNIIFSCGSSTDSYTLTQEAHCIVLVETGSTVSSSSGTESISVVSDGSWLASESCSWVSLSPTSGTGNGTVTATYQQNTSGNSRSCNIIFSCGNSTDSYTLTQEGASCTVSVAGGVVVSGSSGSRNISVTSNGLSTWYATESCSWVSISPTSSTGNGTVTATYQQNTSGNSRSCTITFSCGSSSDSYMLTQESCTISVQSGSTVGSSSGNKSISVISDCSWTASESCSWVDLSQTSGTGNWPVNATYQSNPYSNSRSCIITFSCGSLTDSYTLTQEGKPDGVDDIDFIRNLTIYPNPNSGEFILEMELTRPEDLEIKMVNIVGQVIYKDKLKGFLGKYQKTIDLNSNAKGIYMLEVITKEGTINIKVMIK